MLLSWNCCANVELCCVPCFTQVMCLVMCLFCLAAQGEFVIFPSTQPLPAGVVHVPGHHSVSGKRSSLCCKGLELVLDTRPWCLASTCPWEGGELCSAQQQSAGMAFLTQILPSKFWEAMTVPKFMVSYRRAFALNRRGSFVFPSCPWHWFSWLGELQCSGMEGSGFDKLKMPFISQKLWTEMMNWVYEVHIVPSRAGLQGGRGQVMFPF